MIKAGVLALQGDVREHVRALESAGASAVPVKGQDELADIDALVIPGGESTTIGKLLDRFELVDPIRARMAGGMAVYGTCAGAILLADRVVGRDAVPTTVGGLDIAVRRNAYGRQTDSFETDLVVSGIDSPFRAVFIRAPIIEAIGPDVETLAEHDGAPVLVRQGRIYASTFHPELTGDARIHEMFVSAAGI